MPKGGPIGMNRTADIPRSDGPLAAASSELERINTELAALFARDPVKLAGGADEARADPLVVCGLLGGKDVGKSTLINTLAGREISVDREEVGAGTSRPLVYVHEKMSATAQARLARVGDGLELRFVTHAADAVGNMVLVDLPDFDSDFMQHQAIVEAMVPHLDRVVWVATPRKIADRAWVAFADDVVKADTNVYFALNKCDELLADEEGWSAATGGPGVQREAAEFYRRQGQWAQDVLAAAGHAVAGERLFLMAAKYPQPETFLERVGRIWDDADWRHYGGDRPVVAAIGRRLAEDVGRLRECVLGRLDDNEIAEVKERNLRAQIRRNALRIREAYEVDHWLGQLESAMAGEYRQAMLNDAFGPEYCRAVATSLLRTRRSDIELADEVMDVRAGRWPLLSVLYWLSRWLIRRVGRSLSPGAGQSGAGPAESFRFRSRGLADRVESLVHRLRTEHSAVVRHMGLQERFPDPVELAGRMESELAELPRKGDEEVIERLTVGYRPGLLRRTLVWVVLLWFPFVQPVAEGMLEMLSAGTRITAWVHGLYRVVWALGATQLLKGFALVVLVYAACLAAIYARCVRDVQALRRHGSEGAATGFERADSRQEARPLAEAIDHYLLTEAGGATFRPFETSATQLGLLARRLEDLSG